MDKTNGFHCYLKDDKRNVVLSFSANLIKQNDDDLYGVELPTHITLVFTINGVVSSTEHFITEFLGWEDLRWYLLDRIFVNPTHIGHDILHYDYLAYLLDTVFDNSYIRSWYNQVGELPKQHTVH